MSEQPGNGYAMILDRTETLRRDLGMLDRRIERNEQTLQGLLVLPRLVEDLRREQGEQRTALAGLATERQRREEWLEAFNLQLQSFATSKVQNVKSSSLTVYAIGSSIIMGLVLFILTLLSKSL